MASDLFTRICLSKLGVEVITEYRFHPKRLWKFDYCIPDKMIAIEVEGGVWTNGRHTRGKGFLGDMEKYNQAVVMGWRLVRTTPDKLISSDTITMIKSIMELK